MLSAIVPFIVPAVIAIVVLVLLASGYVKSPRIRLISFPVCTRQENPYW